MTDLMTLRLEDLPEIRPAPEGRYAAVVSKVFSGKIPKDDGSVTHYADVVFKLVEPKDDSMDMTGVDLRSERPAYRLWITEKSLQNLGRDLKQFGIALQGELADALDQLPGIECEVVVGFKRNKDKELIKTKDGNLISEVKKFKRVA